MKIRVIKFIIMLVISAMSLGIYAGCTIENNNEDTTTDQTTAKPVLLSVPYTSPAEFDLMIPGSWFSWAEDLGFQNMLKELNLKLNISEVSGPTYNEQVQLSIATGEIPDVMLTNFSNSLKYGVSGAFKELSQYKEYLPDYINYATNVLKPECTDFYTTNEGKFYIFPRVNEMNNVPAFMWGANIDEFQRLGITIPKTIDELYNAAKIFKSTNPQWTPIAVPPASMAGVAGVASPLEYFLPLLGAGSIDMNYYVGKDTYKYSPLQPEFKEAIVFLNKLYTEQLIPQDYATMTVDAYRRNFEGDFMWAKPDTLREGDEMYPYKTDPVTYQYHFKNGSQSTAWILATTWKELRMFASTYKRVTLNKDLYNSWGASPNIQVIDYPTPASGKISLPQVRYTPDTSGYVINAGVDEDKLNVILAFFNWNYSDAGILRTNYGKEGVHYKMVNGKPVITPETIWDTLEWIDNWNIRRFTKDENEKARMWELLSQSSNILGIFGDANFVRTSAEWYSTIINCPNILEINEKVMAMSEDKFNIRYNRNKVFNDVETDASISLRLRIGDFVRANLDAFVMGQKNMSSDWDAFIKQVKDMGTEKLETMYNK